MKSTGIMLFIQIIMLLPLKGQQHDYIWTMGRDYDLGNDVIEGNILDFNSGILSIIPDSFYLELFSTMTNICDASGNLQFYTNGCKIANGQHELIENGEGINPGESHDDFCFNASYPWRGYYPGGKQSALSLPAPREDSLYYLIHEANEVVVEPNGNLAIVPSPLYFTMIDMRYNDGKGLVTQKNEIITTEESLYGQLTAVKHSNGVDWWILKPGEQYTNTYILALLTDTGIELQNNLEIGLPSQSGGGWANFSPDGTKYARYHPVIDKLFLFDFNRATGALNNFQHIIIEEEEEWVGGVAFSPNSRFLYVSSYDFIYQFDTWAEDIAASRIIVGEYEYLNQLIEHNFWGMQLGPDCKMYVYCNSCDVIHVIHNPDEQGLACDFEQAAVQLPWPIFRSQPHFPNYRLGPVGNEGLPCTPVVSVQEIVIPNIDLSVFPNPASDKITLTSQDISGEWGLYDELGRLVLQAGLQKDQQLQLSIADLPKGLYFWRVSASFLSGKIIVQ